MSGYIAVAVSALVLLGLALWLAAETAPTCTCGRKDCGGGCEPGVPYPGMEPRYGGEPPRNGISEF